MRSSFANVALGFAVSSVIGCGNDPKPATDAAVDAAPDAGPPAFKGFGADEGGEIRFEHIRFAPGVNGTRVSAFLYKTAGPTRYFPFPTAPSCLDTSARDKWPLATN